MCVYPFKCNEKVYDDVRESSKEATREIGHERRRDRATAPPRNKRETDTFNDKQSQIAERKTGGGRAEDTEAGPLGQPDIPHSPRQPRSGCTPGEPQFLRAPRV
jgi:hypothetical protein